MSFYFTPAQVVVLFACHTVPPSIGAWLPQLVMQACHCVTAKPLYSFMSPSLQCENSLFLDLSLKLQWDTYL